MQPTTPKPRADRLWTHREAAEYLRISPSLLYKIRSEGKFVRPIRIGRLARFDPAEVQAWAQDHREMEGGEPAVSLPPSGPGGY